MPGDQQRSSLHCAGVGLQQGSRTCRQNEEWTTKRKTELKLTAQLHVQRRTPVTLPRFRVRAAADLSIQARVSSPNAVPAGVKLSRVYFGTLVSWPAWPMYVSCAWCKLKKTRVGGAAVAREYWRVELARSPVRCDWYALRAPRWGKHAPRRRGVGSSAETCTY